MNFNYKFFFIIVVLIHSSFYNLSYASLDFVENSGQLLSPKRVHLNLFDDEELHKKSKVHEDQSYEFYSSKEDSPFSNINPDILFRIMHAYEEKSLDNQNPEISKFLGISSFFWTTITGYSRDKIISSENLEKPSKDNRFFSSQSYILDFHNNSESNKRKSRFYIFCLCSIIKPYDEPIQDYIHSHTRTLYFFNQNSTPNESFDYLKFQKNLFVLSLNNINAVFQQCNDSDDVDLNIYKKVYSLEEIFKENPQIKNLKLEGNIELEKDIQNCYYLESLTITNNQSNTLNLTNYCNLRSLELAHTSIRRFIGLDSCHRLESIAFSFNNSLTELNLESLKNLTSLTIRNSFVKKLVNLQDCNKLEVLILSTNRLFEYLNLKGLERLKILKAPRNNIARLEGVEDCKKLQSLSLAYNTSLKSVHLTECKNLEKLNVKGTSLDVKSTSLRDVRKI